MLAHQVQHRLEVRRGPASRPSLAIVYLQDRKPVEALRIIKETRLSTLPEELKRARALIEERRLAELSRTDLAIEMIANQEGPEIDRLRADIYWTGKRWREAGEAYELVAGDQWKDAKHVLGDQERSDDARRAILMSWPMKGSACPPDQEVSRTRWRQRRMRALLPSSVPIRSQAIEFRDIAKVAVSSGSMTEFLRAYRERATRPRRDRSRSPASEQPMPEAPTRASPICRRSRSPNSRSTCASRTTGLNLTASVTLDRLPATRCQPSTRTKKISLNGNETVTGGTIIMPIEIRIDDTTRSMIRKGTKSRKPIS